MKSIYGHPINNFPSMRVVSAEEAKRLLKKAIINDEVRVRHGMKPEVHPNLLKSTKEKS